MTTHQEARWCHACDPSKPHEIKGSYRWWPDDEDSPRGAHP